MPRPNVGRSMANEANLAVRVARERQARGMSYEALAKAMTKVGCSINASSLYKIEKGSPPRKVTVEELVAFHQVFDLSIENLLTPIELLDQERAHEILKDVGAAEIRLFEAVADLLGGYSDFYSLAATHPDLHEYARNLRFAPSGPYADARRLPGDDSTEDAGGHVFVLDDVDWDDATLVARLMAFYQELHDEAAKVAALRLGREESSDG
jgi:transcriptional regulator with XRE-family HTH domain